MKTKILRNTFISVGALVAFTQLLAAGTHDGVLNLDNTPLRGAIITFNAPGAGTGPLEGTVPQAINQAEIIAGSFRTQAFVFRGFVRGTDGTFTEFDAPGAGTGQYQGTDVVAIDDAAGAITGFVRDSSDVFHGFLRHPDGTFLTPPFDAPGAGTGTLQGTLPENINATRVITGYYVDSSNVNHGFVRDPNSGMIAAFNARDAGTGPGQGTFVCGPDCLTDAGATVGYYVDSNGVAHGFVRAPDGIITEFNAPGAGTGPNQGTVCSGINQLGTILGTYVDSNNVNHGFERAPDGTFPPSINVPAAGTGPGQGTLLFSINASGAITGTYIDASNVNHGFLLSSNGITTFDAPGAGTSPGQGTQGLCNNTADAITGVYLDSNNTAHGFVTRPQATPRPRPTPAPRP